MTDPETTVRAVDAWLSPTRSFFRAHHPVHIAFAPGDSTVYGFVFVPPITSMLAGPDPRQGPSLYRDEGVLVVLAGTGGGPAAIPIALPGDPHPRYVSEKIDSDNPFTVTAVGVVWALMVGMGPAGVARAFGEAEYGEMIGADVLARWSAFDREQVAS